MEGKVAEWQNPCLCWVRKAAASAVVLQTQKEGKVAPVPVQKVAVQAELEARREAVLSAELEEERAEALLVAWVPRAGMAA